MPATFSRYFVEAPGNTILADHYNGEFNNILTNFDPDGVDDASVNLAAMQATVDPGELSSESLATSLRGELQRLRYAVAEAKFGPATSRKWYESPATGGGFSAVPIGSIIPFYDFNAALTFDTNVWVYCDGSTATVGGSSRTLPDLSNRYLVGFGTEAGGDIDSASWSTSVVGNASHQVNLQHTHTVSGSTASGTTGISASHSHTHTDGTLFATITSNGGSGDDIALAEVSTPTNWTSTVNYSLNRGTESVSYGTGVDIGGTTATPNTSTVTVTDGGHTHSVGTLANANSLSTTQDIQPRSIRVRFIMRKA